MSLESKIRYWADKMDKAFKDGDMKTYNLCVEKIQELEKQQGF